MCLLLGNKDNHCIFRCYVPNQANPHWRLFIWGGSGGGGLTPVIYIYNINLMIIQVSHICAIIYVYRNTFETSLLLILFMFHKSVVSCMCVYI
jgi:hypothetical protein